VSEENIDFINGNLTVSDTSLFTGSFKSGVFTVSPNCLISSAGTNGVTTTELNTVTSTSIVARTTNSTNGSKVAVTYNLVCQKQGVDYVGKTAKAVSSDQNISSPGTIKSTLCSAKISAAGVISDHKGGCFASCTNATTPVCAFTSNYWVSGQVPNCWGITDVAGTSTGNATTSTSTDFAVRVIDSTFATVSGARRYFCHGERQ
jgi:hypothetical protein